MGQALQDSSRTIRCGVQELGATLFGRRARITEHASLYHRVALAAYHAHGHEPCADFNFVIYDQDVWHKRTVHPARRVESTAEVRRFLG